MSLALSDNLSPNLSPTLGCYGQTPRKVDFPGKITQAKPHYFPGEPETTIEKCKRYAWTAFPLLTLIKPLEPAVIYLTEIARTVKSIELLMKSGDRKTALYHVFRTCLSIGAMSGTVLEHSSSPLVRRFFVVIKLLSIGHEIALAANRLDRLPENENEYKTAKLCCLIACNIFGMIAIVFQNSFTTLMFLGMQCATGLLHTLRQLDKDKYFAASVHLLIAIVRLNQSFRILHNLLFPEPPPVPSLRELEEIVKTYRRTLIASTEKIKESLTRYEIEVQRLLGEEYLYFKKNGPKEKFLILSTEADYNTAFDPWKITSIVRKLSAKFDVKFRTIFTVEDIEKEVRLASQAGRVMGLMLRAHGSPTTMHLSDTPGSGWLTTRTVSPHLFEGLDPDGMIILDSCSTAGGIIRHFSLAARVANLSQRKTIASDRVCNGITLKQTDPMEWSFERIGSDAQTITMVPLKDDRFITYLKSLFILPSA
ncbi:MAG TPA: hypothetical protein VMR37_08340 [Rhabdochlamydiaceae bacterium]|jgi:hypothetical protein|nr:hypothetical protein [Rhabdochlamydiaceae bacterium]